MPPQPRFACDRCGRALNGAATCGRHPHSPRLDLTRRADAEWREQVLQLQRGRRVRMASFAALGLATVGGLATLGLSLFAQGLVQHLIFSSAMAEGVAMLAHGLVLGLSVAVVSGSIWTTARWLMSGVLARLGTPSVALSSGRHGPEATWGLVYGALLTIAIISPFATVADLALVHVHAGAAVAATVLLYGARFVVELCALIRDTVRGRAQPQTPTLAGGWDLEPVRTTWEASPLG